MRQTSLFMIFLLLPLTGKAQIMEPNAPILDFKLPVFSETGYKAWDLHGDEGLFQNNQTIDVKIMTIRIFSGDEKSTLETLIESPSATINPQQSTASSNELIKITGIDYNITGNTWTWDGKSNQIDIRENVFVTFNQPSTAAHEPNL